VSKYDGRVFKTYTKEDGLADNWVFCILQDSLGRFWFGTKQGVTMLQDNKWQTYRKEDGLAGDIVYEILEDRSGYLWFVTEDGGVSRLDPGSGFDRSALRTFRTEDGLADNHVESVIEDRAGKIWFGTYAGVSVYDGEKFESITVADGLPDNRIWAVLEDAKGSFWFGTGDKGVCRYNTKDGGKQITQYSQDEGLAGNVVIAIFEDNEGDIWFGTVGGASRFDGKSFTNFTVKDGLADNVVYSVFQDRESYLWFGNDAGVNRYDGRAFTTYTTEDGLVDDELISIMQDRDGNLWLGTNGGISRYDGDTFTTFTTAEGLSVNRIEASFQDSNGTLWFGTWGGGAIRFDGGSFTTFSSADGLPNDWVVSIFEDREGNLWFGTGGGLEGTGGGGVTQFDGNRFRTYTVDDGLAGNVVWSICEDTGGNLWFGTRTGGVSRYDGKEFTNYTTEQGLADNWIETIFLAHDGNLWFGTRSGGISRFDGNKFRAFSKEHGLSDNWVESIFQDNENHLWFVMRGGGVSRHNPTLETADETPTFQTLLQQDGLAGNSVRSVLQDQKGDLWFGTNKGLTRYRSQPASPPVVLLDAVVADQRYTDAADLQISSEFGVLSFEYHALSIKTRPGAMIYRYRLEGFEEDWRTTHDERVEYTNLPIGSYRFVIEAVDRDLVKSDYPAVIQMTVHYPYVWIGWMSLLAASLVLIGYLTLRVIRRGKRLVAANEALTAEIEERERVEAERLKLDDQLQQLHFLFRLRTSLSSAWSSEEVIDRAGKSIMEVLSTSDSGGATIEHDGRHWSFGDPEREGLLCYVRSIRWGERERGVLSLYSAVDLSGSQERALLDESVGQIGRVLEAKELEMQLLQSARLVSMGQMAAGVAHELNQPLGAISATAEDFYLRLREGLAVDEKQWGEMLKRVMGMVERMSGTVEHLRVFSRDSAEEPGVELSVNDVIRSSVDLIGTQLQSRGIELELYLTEGIPKVMGNANQLEQVFLNLVGNARDAVDEKEHELPEASWGKFLSIRTEFEQNGEGYVVAKVEDNGTGISASDTARVFDPFFTTKEASRGTGLGLSISYAIIKNHGGQILCESRQGKGSIFRVRLPITKGH